MPRFAQVLSIAACLTATSPVLAETTETTLQEPSIIGASDPAADRGTDDGSPATLIGPGDRVAIGGFGSLGMRYARMLDRNTALPCADGGLLIDHAMSIGAGGCGLATAVDADAVTSRPLVEGRFNFGYGGGIVRYHFLSRELVNVSIGTMVGGGAIVFEEINREDDDPYVDTVFVFEPEAGVHLNVTRWMRVSAVGSYRLVGGADTEDVSNGDLSGIAAGGSVQFGWF